MRRLLAALMTVALLPILYAQPDVAVASAMRTAGMEHATVSVCLYDMDGGIRLYGHNEQQSLTPASLQKLLTTGAAMARMGSTFRFTTRLLMCGEVDRDGVLHGDLYIIGGGDPLLGSYRYKQTTPDTLFAQWTSALRSRGVGRIEGHIYYIDDLFDGSRLHDSWQHGDVGNYYGAGASGLNFHENMYFAHFNAGVAVGAPATIVRTVPKNLSLQETNQVLTGATGSGDQVVVYGMPDEERRLYTGTMPLGKKDFGIRAALPHPARTCANLLATHLRTHGISVSHGASPATRPPDSVRIVSEYYSPVLRQIVQYTNRTSNNIYAEAMFKYLGYQQQGKGNFSTGSRAIEAFIEELGLDYGGVHIVDGSGLSRLNRTTADFLCRYLVRIARESWWENYLGSLRTAPDASALHYKTGSMEGIRAQAGYIIDGHRRAYAVIISNYDCSSATADSLLKQIVQQLSH